ncbi:MAG: hypothetical protein K5770_06335, partial [Lachnospiraceae bacterium]|nr:hypothetical protein [Lachnospiraceae bacterium]
SVLILWSMILTYHRTYDFFVIITVLSFMHVPKCPAYIRILYSAALIGVFFVLRLFSESVPSRIAVGALYYILTVSVTIEACRLINRYSEKPAMKGEMDV